MEIDNHYADREFDRADTRRLDAEWLAARVAEPATRIHPVWRGRCMVEAGDKSLPATVPSTRVTDETAEHLIFLGIEDDVARFALPLEDLAPLGMVEEAFQDVRDLAPELSRRDGAVLAYARGLAHWHRTHKFCGICGAPSRSERAGHMRRCTNADCGRMHFPRTDPAVITLVHDGPRCLLARRSTWGFNRRSTIAGFVEIGEMLEDAVRREIMEEVGVEVTDVRYHSSQPWPFPCSLMLGFTARATTTEITVDGEEIVAAAWYTREEIAEQTASGELTLPPFDSISHLLVTDWIETGAD